ncbi:hypothetical protein [Sinomonas sp. P47F7]|uniref:hypothetical protein n=1 Tax=Sinomonas sp. P47F7 TaxID=3410987 RepID=UPI003BF4D9D7
MNPSAFSTLMAGTNCNAAIVASSPAYDEILHEVTDHARATNSIGKADVGALLFWKRLRADTPWVSELMIMNDSEVRAITAKTMLDVRDESPSVPKAARAGRRALSPLPGFQSGDALASALLFAAAPDRMAVHDRPAHAGLMELGLPLSNARGRYGRYMLLVEDLREAATKRGHCWSARDVDLALYQLGGKIPRP